MWRRRGKENEIQIHGFVSSRDVKAKEQVRRYIFLFYLFYFLQYLLHSPSLRGKIISLSIAT
jgi:hypothetical protein